MSKKAKYATIGAIGGAAVGQIAGGDTKSTLIGAATGAAIGGGTGYYMDKQEAQLRDKLNNTGVKIQRSGDEIYLIMPNNITFKTNQYAVKPSSYDVLSSVAIVLKKYNKTQIVVDGHTDSIGTKTHNRTLSEKRAGSIKNYLVAQGVFDKRVRTTGFGSSKPIATNKTSHGRQQNRRVKITLIPIE
jgi:outer membrane protein OmpA-like peptidoglycan-associated protein